MFTEAQKKLHEIGRLKPLSVPKIPKGKSARLSDADDSYEDEGEHVAKDIGAAYFITYIKSNGEESNRRVAIKKVGKSTKGDVILKCFCYERSALRTFRADRITEAVDIATGEIFNDFQSLLNNLTGIHVVSDKQPPSETSLVISKCRYAINILVFLGRCDGRLDPMEVDVIYQFLMKRHFEVNLDEQEVQNYINRLHPDHEIYVSSIDSVESPEDIKQIIKYACRMIQADEIITPEEHLFVEEMQQYVNER